MLYSTFRPGTDEALTSVTTLYTAFLHSTVNFWHFDIFFVSLPCTLFFSDTVTALIVLTFVNCTHDEMPSLIF